MMRTILRLYHGSDVVIEHPTISRGTGFADLGHGFYLTDDHDAACRRARTRARHEGAAAGVVSVFDLDERCLPWVVWGERGLEVGEAGRGVPFGLTFDATEQGIAAWMRYIKACRSGRTAVEGLGEPAIVRAWIATEEVEMVCTGMVSASEMAPLMDPSELVAQCCVLDQTLADEQLEFVRAENLPV